MVASERRDADGVPTADEAVERAAAGPVAGGRTRRQCGIPAIGLEPRPCAVACFERIYFSRGNDADIHRERRALGKALLPKVLKYTDPEWERNFFSYIPNTAQISFHGLLEGCMELPDRKPPRFGQIAVKDAKFRTFIADANARRDVFQHVYDITYGMLEPGRDTLWWCWTIRSYAANTMRRALLPVLDRLQPKRLDRFGGAAGVLSGLFTQRHGQPQGIVAFRGGGDAAGSGGGQAGASECYHKPNGI